MRTAPIGAPRAKIAPFSTKIGSLEPQRKIKFSMFFGSEIFFPVGSLTDKTGPQPTKWPPAPENGYISGPRDTWDPKQGSLGMRSNLVSGRSAQNGPQDRKNPLFRFLWPVSGPGRPQNFSTSPRPQNPVNCELRPHEAEPRRCKMYESFATP